MSSVYRKYLLVCFVLITLGSKRADAKAIPSDYQVVKSLRDDFLTFDSRLGFYVPLVVNTRANISEVSFFVNLREYASRELMLCLPPESYVFIDQQIVYRAKVGTDPCKVLQIDSLLNTYQTDTLFFSIFHPTVNVGNIDVAVVAAVAKAPLAKATSNDLLAIMLRPSKDFLNFFGLGMLILLVFFTILINIYGKAFSEYYDYKKAVALRFREEGLHAAKTISVSFIFFLIFHSLLVAFIMITILHYIELWPEMVYLLNTQALGASFKSWFMLAFLIFATLILKYIYVVSVGALFNLRSFSNLQYYDFVRMSKVFFLLIFGMLIFVLYGLGYNYQLWLKVVIYTIIFFSIIRFIILYLKLLKFSSFRNLHLFLYICSTELLPLFIGFKLFFNS